MRTARTDLRDQPLTDVAPRASGGAPGAAQRESSAESIDVVFRDLRTTATGLTSREASRRLVIEGVNGLARTDSRRWPRELLSQLTQPLALLLAVAAILAAISGSLRLSGAIVAVIALNAVFAFLQERHAEHAVEALAAYLPTDARAVRDGVAIEVDAKTLVPGDVLAMSEGDRVSADARLISGALEVDMSTLTGESQPVTRNPGDSDPGVVLLEAANMTFSGSAVLAGEAQAVITATGMHTEIGRIASLSQRVSGERSPLEKQVNRAARVIAVVSIIAAVAFLPLGLAAGLSTAAAVSFAIGILVANVPEGLLPTITLALAAGVEHLAGKGAVVKRLSAVETLGSTTVICTDKTGTLTQNRMQVTGVWTHAGPSAVDEHGRFDTSEGRADELPRLLAMTAARCSNVTLAADTAMGDPTEIALARLAARSHPPGQAPSQRRSLFPFDPRLRLMTTVDTIATTGEFWASTKGAPEAVLPLVTDIAVTATTSKPMTEGDRRNLATAITRYTTKGLRVLAVARRALDERTPMLERGQVERNLCLLGVVAMVDPPRPQVSAAIERAHAAGLRIHVVTGDNGETATEIARQVGIGTGHAGTRTILGDELDLMTDSDLDSLLGTEQEMVFARSSPEAKLRIADALQSIGEVVAMTGDGVNDAPALRAADIGVAMGRSGTEVARQAATMVLTDDNFATIIDAVEEGRRVYDNVRKFILYIFTHAVPEVVPFLVFALSGGAIPLPLTVMQLLAIDLLTDTLPALALSREPSEPGTMSRPPRSGTSQIIDRSLLLRAWGFLGLISAVLVLSSFFLVLHHGGWHLDDATGGGAPLHHLYQQATTIAWLGIVSCQVGTALAARTERVSTWRIGLTSNPLLLGAIGIEILLAVSVAAVPFLHSVFGTVTPSTGQILLILPFPFIMWGADELRKLLLRHRGTG